MKPECAFSTLAGPELIFHVVFMFLYVFSQGKPFFSVSQLTNRWERKAKLTRCGLQLKPKMRLVPSLS